MKSIAIRTTDEVICISCAEKEAIECGYLHLYFLKTRTEEIDGGEKCKKCNYSFLRKETIEAATRLNKLLSNGLNSMANNIKEEEKRREEEIKNK